MKLAIHIDLTAPPFDGDPDDVTSQVIDELIGAIYSATDRELYYRTLRIGETVIGHATVTEDD